MSYDEVIEKERLDAIDALEAAEKALEARADEIYADSTMVGDMMLSIADTHSKNHDINDDNIIHELVINAILNKNDPVKLAVAIEKFRGIYYKHSYELAEKELN